MLVSFIGLLGGLPLLFLVGLAVYLEDGRPIVYKQTRIGKDGRLYSLVKFRSMRVNNLLPEEIGQVNEDHPLVTRVGRLIRRTKIDELPQLMNVLLGDMSLVGPRPTIPEQVQRYGDFESRRLLVRPGMTGWAQVNGNTRLSWVERIALDIWYVDHWSLWLDYVILIRTVGVVLLGERPRPEAVQVALDYAATLEPSRGVKSS